MLYYTKMQKCDFIGVFELVYVKNYIYKSITYKLHAIKCLRNV